MGFLWDYSRRDGHLAKLDDDPDEIFTQMGCKKLTDKVQRAVYANVNAPIGNAPTWIQILDILHHDPRAFVTPYTRGDLDMELDALNEQYVHAQNVFVLFTRAMLEQLPSPQYTHGMQPALTSFDDAMLAWNVQDIMDRFLHPEFEPINCDVANARGALDVPFEERAAMLFPSLKHPAPTVDNSHWSVLWRAGYIHEYHEILCSRDADEDAIADTLKLIFGHVHCLPSITPHTSKDKGLLFPLS